MSRLSSLLQYHVVMMRPDIFLIARTCQHLFFVQFYFEIEMEEEDIPLEFGILLLAQFPIIFARLHQFIVRAQGLNSRIAKKDDTINPL